MVPGLAVDHEEFSTPPSSPVLATRTLRAIISDSNTATPSPINLHDIPQQLRESASSYTERESNLVICSLSLSLSHQLRESPKNY